MKRIFITGIAGFIGFHLAKELSARGDEVVGCDNFNDYYDPNLKKERAKILNELGVVVHTCDLLEPRLATLIEDHNTTHIVHLAAQAGVRMSIHAPQKYHEANTCGFFHILEILRQRPTIECVFASSSSVYGLNKKIPFAETDPTDRPANFYGATKKSGEIMAHAYHHIHSINMRILRFFTVYGPYGRPDMAYYSFAEAIKRGETINLFNGGDMLRDFTYIDDIVRGTVAAIDYSAPFEIFNLGNNKPEKLLDMISYLEAGLGKKAILEKLPMQPGEIHTTYADIEKARRLLNFAPSTSLKEGISSFLDWYQSRDQTALCKNFPS